MSLEPGLPPHLLQGRRPKRFGPPARSVTQAILEAAYDIPDEEGGDGLSDDDDDWDVGGETSDDINIEHYSDGMEEDDIQERIMGGGFQTDVNVQLHREHD